MNTYVRNVFEAKQINVNKYLDDDNNADGLRPDNVRITIDEHLPQYDNLSAQTEGAHNSDLAYYCLDKAEELIYSGLGKLGK